MELTAKELYKVSTRPRVYKSKIESTDEQNKNFEIIKKGMKQESENRESHFFTYTFHDSVFEYIGESNVVKLKNAGFDIYCMNRFGIYIIISWNPNDYHHYLGYKELNIDNLEIEEF